MTDKVAISPEILFQDVSSDVVLLDLARETYYGLEGAGARIWELLQTHACLGDVHRIMVTEYDVDSEQLATDLLAHVEEMMNAGLLTLRTAP